MSFTKKTWVDRVSENPNRRTLTIISQDENTRVVDVARTEGEVSKEGDAFNAENMNDLESRVEAALGEKLDGQKLESDPAAILEKTKADGSAPDCYAIKQLYDQLKKLVADGKKQLADAISAQGITTASADMTFAQLAEAITSTGAGRYSAGYNTGYDKGKEDGSAAGSQSGYNQGYAAGKADGISYADGRVNGNSASYTAGYNAGVPAGKNAASGRTSCSVDLGLNKEDVHNANGYVSGSCTATASLSGGRLSISIGGSMNLHVTAWEGNEEKYKGDNRKGLGSSNATNVS